ncbi:MAG: glycerophosphodiester phosphodiesterase family protein [Ferruginibacter sp.]|nr:glycerophosphodiester phosphodiesterase family protein [Cytophagales bacterium]
MIPSTRTLLRRILIAQVFFVAFSANAQQIHLDSIVNDFNNHPERILVAAHRSAHQKHPENSLAAMQETINLGVDIIELDVRQTKDGELVILHDKTVDRTTTGQGEVSSFTLAELKKFQLLFKGQPTPEKVPTFEEALQLTKGKIMIDIDFKLTDEKAVAKTYALVKKYGMEKQVLFFLSRHQYTAQLHALNEQIKIMPRAHSAADVEDILKFDYITVIHADDKFYSDSLMRGIREAGVRVWMNALGKYDGMEQQNKNSGFEKLLEKKHINVIQTDLPGELLLFLKERHLHL